MKCYLEKKKKKVIKYSNNIIFTTKNFHLYIEKGISNVSEKKFRNINIKYDIWNDKRALEFNTNEVSYNEVKYDTKNIIFLKCIYNKYFKFFYF